ncbi:MAG TPA: hypothetical protein VGH48_07910, partial [Caldimonas sp.]
MALEHRQSACRFGLVVALGDAAENVDPEVPELVRRAGDGDAVERTGHAAWPNDDEAGHETPNEVDN